MIFCCLYSPDGGGCVAAAWLPDGHVEVIAAICIEAERPLVVRVFEVCLARAVCHAVVHCGCYAPICKLLSLSGVDLCVRAFCKPAKAHAASRCCWQVGCLSAYMRPDAAGAVVLALLTPCAGTLLCRALMLHFGHRLLTVQEVAGTVALKRCCT
jgi:hypothetical protein